MPAERVLLIGGTGFIGRALARRLAETGREVHVLSRHADLLGQCDDVTFHRGCQSMPEIIAPLLERCDTVVHLAAATTPGSSAGRPSRDVNENLLPLAGFLEQLAHHEPKRVLFLSSGGAIYGNPSMLPVREDHPVGPLSWHAAGKVAAEEFLRTYVRQMPGTSLAILRPANVYGPGQTMRTGFGFVRTLLEKARTGGSIELWGDGRQVRDYLFIDDLLDACMCLLDAPSVAGTFNVGSGVGTSLLELVRLAEEVTGRAISVEFQPPRGIDVDAIWLDSGRINAATGWKAQILLAEGLALTWDELVHGVAPPVR